MLISKMKSWNEQVISEYLVSQYTSSKIKHTLEGISLQKKSVAPFYIMEDVAW